MKTYQWLILSIGLYFLIHVMAYVDRQFKNAVTVGAIEVHGRYFQPLGER